MHAARQERDRDVAQDGVAEERLRHPARSQERCRIRHCVQALPALLPGEQFVEQGLIDVRQRNEFETGHLPGAVNLELGDLATSAVPEGPVTVMCGHGERAMTGASILASRGHRDVSVLDGGPDTGAAWTGHPLAVDR